jgi:hypothetical protein
VPKFIYKLYQSISVGKFLNYVCHYLQTENLYNYCDTTSGHQKVYVIIFRKPGYKVVPSVRLHKLPRLMTTEAI